MSLTGTIIQLDDGPRAKCRHWELRVNLPKDGGRYPKRTRRFTGTYTQAKAALRDFIAEVEADDWSKRDKWTFARYAEQWRERRASSGMYSPSTVESDRMRTRALCRHIGNMNMRDITTRDVENSYSAMIAGKTLSGKPASPKTVEDMHKTLSSIMQDAVRDGVIDSAPTSGAKRPNVPQATRNVPDGARIDEMVDSLDLDDACQMAVALCACCGLRRAEACALDWSDYDGESLTVHSAIASDGTVKSTKSGMVRTVPVPDRLRARLYPGDGLMAPVLPHSVTRWWSRHRESIGMDGVRFHDLRHAYLTRLAEAGVHPRVMMELAGHSSIDVCMNIYTHVDDEARRSAVEAAFDS